MSGLPFATRLAVAPFQRAVTTHVKLIKQVAQAAALAHPLNLFTAAGLISAHWFK